MKKLLAIFAAIAFAASLLAACGPVAPGPVPMKTPDTGQ